MFFTLKLMIYSIALFLIFSIPVNEKPLFNYVYSQTAPHTDKLFQVIMEKVRSGINTGKRVGSKFFSNISPGDAASPQKNVVFYNEAAETEAKAVRSDEYTDEEKALLKKIINEGDQ